MDKQEQKGIKLPKKYTLWLKAAGIRAIKTCAQAALGVIGTSYVLADVNWLVVGSSAILAGIISLLTSLNGLPELKE